MTLEHTGPPPQARRVLPLDGRTPEEDAAARLVKRVYTEEMRRRLTGLKGRPSFYEPNPRWDGGPPRLNPEGSTVEGGRTRGSTWLKAARVLLGKAIDPEDYVRRQFEAHIQGIVPMPNELVSVASLKIYEQSRQYMGERLAARLRSQGAVAEQAIAQLTRIGHLSRVDAWEQVVRRPPRELTPLFRYCLARGAARELTGADAARMVRAAGALLVDAAMEYMRNPTAYDRAWAAMLPAGFQEAAREVFARRFAGEDDGRED